jgi:hypothetical protein
MVDDRTARVYRALAPLPRMNHLTPKCRIPKNGIYFFFESEESAVLDGAPVGRIVRVGTHTKGLLPDRLADHFEESGVSIFKWHVCCAMLAKENPGHPGLHTERPYLSPKLQGPICGLMRRAFGYVCVRLEDPDCRDCLEKGLIALLAKRPLGVPSPGWLGRHAVKTYREGQ